MTGRKTRALKVPPVVPYKALGTYSARFFRPVMVKFNPALSLWLLVSQKHAQFCIISTLTQRRVKSDNFYLRIRKEH